MTPTKSNLNKETCSPVSSNCVIWQGPDITCLNLCKGDSISDVTYKLATEVCTLINNMGISAVELTEIVNACGSTPEPAKTLTNVLNLIIGKVVCISTKLDAIPIDNKTYIPPTFTPSNYTCLANDITRSIELNLEQFIDILAIKICSVNDDVTALAANVLQNTADIETIRAQYYHSPTLPTLTNCITNETKSIELVLDDIQTRFCDYAETLGSTSTLSDAGNAQCADLNTATRLCGDGKQVMSTINNWNPTVTTLGQSLQNLWLTVCDIRCAVKLIQENCCKVNCADVTVDFDYKWVDAVTLKLFFTPKTKVPAGFYDCGDNGDTNPGSGQFFTFTDGNGGVWTNPSGMFHFRYRNPTNNLGIVTNTDIIVQGYTLDLTNAKQLDVTTGLTVTGNVCFSDGSNSCIKCLNKTISPYSDGTKTCCEIMNTSTTESVTVVYQICKN